MKKFVTKVLTVVLALALASGLMVVRGENVLHEMPGDAGVAYGANSVDFFPPAGVIAASVAVVFEFAEGEESDWNAYIALDDLAWEQGNREDPRFTTEPGRLTFDISAINDATFVRLSDWWPGGYQLGVTRVLFIGEAGAVFEAPAVTVNPLTGDGAGVLWPVVSGVGLVAALAALTAAVKRRKK